MLESAGTEDTELRLAVNDRDRRFRLGDLLQGSKVMAPRARKGNPIGARKVKVHQAIASTLCECECRFTDDAPDPPTDTYYLRVTQANGQMAWSSPIWASR